MSRRHKIWMMPIEELELILEWKNAPDNSYLYLHSTEDIPPSAKIVQVHHDYATNALAIVMESPEFDKVGDGCITPRANNPAYIQRVLHKPLEEVGATHDE